MKCPFCHNDSDKVVDSRVVRNGYTVRRRRECLECGRRYTTYEYIEETQVLVIKKDGRRVPFDRAKIVDGLRLACRKRPISADKIESVANSIEIEMNERGSLEVSSSEIGEIVMERLAEIDRVAYVRFASVYRSFDDVGEFQAEVEKFSGGED